MSKKVFDKTCQKLSQKLSESVRNCQKLIFIRVRKFTKFLSFIKVLNFDFLKIYNCNLIFAIILGKFPNNLLLQADNY